MSELKENKELVDKLFKQCKGMAQLENGYQMRTTFWQDFTIAEAFGLDAIQDTYDRAFAEWHDNVEYVTELCMVLNWKLFQWYEKDRDFYFLYVNLYYDVDDWCYRNLKGDDLTYFLKTTD